VNKTTDTRFDADDSLKEALEERAKLEKMSQAKLIPILLKQALKGKTPLDAEQRISKHIIEHKLTLKDLKKQESDLVEEIVNLTEMKEITKQIPEFMVLRQRLGVLYDEFDNRLANNSLTKDSMQEIFEKMEKIRDHFDLQVLKWAKIIDFFNGNPVTGIYEYYAQEIGKDTLDLLASYRKFLGTDKDEKDMFHEAVEQWIVRDWNTIERDFRLSNQDDFKKEFPKLKSSPELATIDGDVWEKVKEYTDIPSSEHRHNANYIINQCIREARGNWQDVPCISVDARKRIIAYYIRTHWDHSIGDYGEQRKKENEYAMRFVQDAVSDALRKCEIKEKGEITETVKSGIPAPTEKTDSSVQSKDSEKAKDVEKTGTTTELKTVEESTSSRDSNAGLSEAELERMAKRVGLPDSEK
jgi:hypothetical protein